MMKNFEVLNSLMLSCIKGGRSVDKKDLDGDGNWDIKIITRNDGTIVTKTRK